MASVTPLQEIQEEAKCPICQRYLKDPITIDCRDNFGRVCITEHWEKCDELDNGPLCCPSCRAPVRNNQQLAKIVEKIKDPDFNQSEENLGERDKETLDLSCDEGGKDIRMVCERSPEHRSHTVLPMEEAAQKHEVGNSLVKGPRAPSMSPTTRFPIFIQKQNKKLTQMKRQKVVSEIQQLWGFLEEQKRLLLEELDKEIVKIQNENVTKLSEPIYHLSAMEGKCQKPESEFLQVTNMYFLFRCEVKKFQTLLGIFPELKKRFSNFSQEPVGLVETLRTFKGTEKGSGANVTLDPDTAHPSLVLSADGKTVKWADILQDLPKNPERFDSRTCVLGREGFSSERHYWEVDVGGGRCWAVGVARESVRRKGWNSFYPEEGIWAVELWWGQFRALTKFRTLLPLPQVPSRIEVCLDCKQGQVAFFNASDGSWIYSFPPGSVPRERMRPWFWVWWDTKPQVRLCP
uniref:Uncharacterized protein n=1 Tax=Pelusios castaneus TaxID=367368 RepID=A0A8C8RDV9_9SAUR